jgi:cell division protein FtsZ
MNREDRIVVIGVGGAGCKVVTRAAATTKPMPGVEWVAVDADTVALQLAEAPHKVLIGKYISRGLGAGGMADVGHRGAEEAADELSGLLQGAGTAIITCGLGGGTSNGAAPVIGRIAQGLGAWTVGVVSKPFTFEGRRRTRLAEEGLADLAAHTNVQIVIPNDGILARMDKKATLLQAFQTADCIILEVIQGLIESARAPGAVRPGVEAIRANIPYRDIAAVTAG